MCVCVCVLTLLLYVCEYLHMHIYYCVHGVYVCVCVYIIRQFAFERKTHPLCEQIYKSFKIVVSVFPHLKHMDVLFF